ncbi:zinc ribbon domain-containing protein [Nonomuraea turcica]|uniref:zinc ribbon domain-containing protein n=1 Tax=Nonomuraea sp. G32 TaxID=3067274 RepID=UPI00273B2795|nr:zinc ribbon domain-containing protein [Nonomuraea sp. G32]MDP4503327.1 zinc ribbon domain-containing protein [Nonomuraea sp. G32]
MAVIVATATCSGYRAVLEATGQVVAGPVLAERVVWLAALTQTLTAGIVADRWNARDLDLLAAGVGPDGRVLPAKGWMAVRRLGWGCAAPVTGGEVTGGEVTGGEVTGTVAGGGVYVSDRVRRCAEEQAARMLRAVLHRRGIVAAILATWPENPRRRSEVEWKALRAALPDGVTPAELRNRTRQVSAVLARTGVLPGDITEVEEPPRVAAQAVLAAADKQLVTLTRATVTGGTGPTGGAGGGARGGGGGGAVLRVQLPLKAAPTSRKDWAWHAIAFTLPPTVPGEAKLCTPTVRVAGGTVRVDVPFQTPVPAAPATGHTVALGLDWGLNTLLTGAVARLRDDRVVSDGRMLRYDATAVSAKLHRLRGQREYLAAKREHCAALLSGLDATDTRETGDTRDTADAGDGSDGGDARRVAVQRRHRVLQVEHERVCARIRRLDHALAWSAARWAVDQALALGAGVIYVEDLATLEARGVRRGNAALSGQVRGAVVEAIRHLAAKDGIAVVTVPARGTSRYCPRCGEGGSVLRHVPAPDRLGERGWKWAYCPGCGLSCDRDHAAAERIAARGLLAQQHTRTDPSTGARSIHKIVEGNVARARRRNKPTRAARRARRTRTDLHPRPLARSRNKDRPTPKRRQTNRAKTFSKTFSRVPDRRTVPAPVPGTPGAGQRPAGQAPQTTRPPAGRTGPVRDPHHRTGFHRVAATPVLPLGTYADGPPRATPARNVLKS